MTYTIPSNKKNKETNEFLRIHFIYLLDWVEYICINPFNMIRKSIEGKNKEDKFYPQDKEYEEIHFQMKRIQLRMKPLISNALEPIFKYFLYLTPEQQDLVEKINKPSIYSYLRYLESRQPLYVEEVQTLLEGFDKLKDDVKSLLDTIKSPH